MKYLFLLLFVSGCTSAPKGCQYTLEQIYSYGVTKITVSDPLAAPGMCMERAKDDMFYYQAHKYTINYEDTRK